MFIRRLQPYSVLILATAMSLPFIAHAELPSPDKSLINDSVIQDIRKFVNTDIVRHSANNQNVRYGDMSEEEILKLDKMWRAETQSDDQPLISATLSNPLSSYLTRIQAHSIGLYSEMFVMDKNGLNVGQSNISSDYWQGDEAKFQKTYPNGPQAVFIDDPEYDEDLGIWRTQVNLSIADENNKDVIGAITVEINLSELERRTSPHGVQVNPAPECPTVQSNVITPSKVEDTAMTGSIASAAEQENKPALDSVN